MVATCCSISSIEAAIVGSRLCEGSVAVWVGAGSSSAGANRAERRKRITNKPKTTRSKTVIIVSNLDFIKCLAGVSISESEYKTALQAGGLLKLTRRK
jgi:hypothetical protein